MCRQSSRLLLSIPHFRIRDAPQRVQKRAVSLSIPHFRIPIYWYGATASTDKVFQFLILGYGAW